MDGIQLGLFGESRPADRWLTMDEAGEVFQQAGVESVVLMARAAAGDIRERLNGRGPEYYPPDVERWARWEGAIAEGLRRNGQHR